MSANFKYDWGEEVRVITTAPASLRPGKAGSVCGMRELDGNRLYIVEFSNGEAIELQEDLIETVKGG